MISITTSHAAHGRSADVLLAVEGPGFFNRGFLHRVNRYTDAQRPTLNAVPSVISAHGQGLPVAGTVRINDRIEVDGTVFRIVQRLSADPVLVREMTTR